MAEPRRRARSGWFLRPSAQVLLGHRNHSQTSSHRAQPQTGVVRNEDYLPTCPGELVAGIEYLSVSVHRPPAWPFGKGHFDSHAVTKGCRTQVVAERCVERREDPARSGRKVIPSGVLLLVELLNDSERQNKADLSFAHDARLIDLLRRLKVQENMGVQYREAARSCCHTIGEPEHLLSKALKQLRLESQLVPDQFLGPEAELREIKDSVVPEPT
jgi:hypothetical protein